MARRLHVGGPAAARGRRRMERLELNRVEVRTVPVGDVRQVGAALGPLPGTIGNLLRRWALAFEDSPANILRARAIRIRPIRVLQGGGWVGDPGSGAPSEVGHLEWIVVVLNVALDATIRPGGKALFGR